MPHRCVVSSPLAVAAVGRMPCGQCHSLAHLFLQSRPVLGALRIVSFALNTVSSV